MTETLSGLLTPALAIIATMILVYQYRLQKLRWRLDLFDKRYAVYLATTEYISAVLRDARVTTELLMKFLRNSRDKEFLFADDVKEHLKRLYNKGAKLQLYITQLEEGRAGKKTEELAQKQEETLTWFACQFDESKKLFGQYLSIEEK